MGYVDSFDVVFYTRIDEQGQSQKRMTTMRLRRLERILHYSTFVLCLLWGMHLTVPCAWAGSLRITLNDGAVLEVPYYWEEGGEIKFEVPNGVAGIPKDQIKSVQEVVASREFNPDAIGDASAQKAASIEQKKMLSELVASKTQTKPSSQKIAPEEGFKLIKKEETGQRSQVGKDQARGPAFTVEGDFSEFVRTDGNSVTLVLRNVLSSRKDLKNQSFALTLLDGEGNVLEQRPCELQAMNVDHKTMKKLGIRGHLYTVMVSVKPDPRIRRYEITAVQQR